METPSTDEPMAARSGRWRRALVPIAVVLLMAVAIVAFVTVREFQRQGRPSPTFPSLADAPDESLHGTVAFISEAKHQGDEAKHQGDKVEHQGEKERQACARVALASGAAARDVYCWSIDEPAQATAVWSEDARLLITSFRAPEGDRPPEPEWAKYVDVSTGRVEDIPSDRLGVGAEPSPGPSANPEGQRLTLESGGGEAVIHLLGPGERARSLLEVTDANPEWSIQAGPVWSPDFAWAMSWDAGLLITTISDTPRTRTLAKEASASPFGFDKPNFSILASDLDIG